MMTRQSNRQQGFTLIELALSLSLIGLALAALLVAFRIYMGDLAINTTKKNVTTIAQAVENFILENGRFPCPASVDLPMDSSYYGQEANCVDYRGYTATAPASAVAPGHFGGGIWVEEGVGNPSNHVVRGMVPFHALNLPEHYAIDGYGSRIMYAVTASQAHQDTFMREGGSISVADSSNPAVDNARTNHFVVFSPGSNKRGAYNRYGKEVLPCGGTMDSENCNTSPANKTATYIAARHSSANDTGQYDDYLVNSTTMQMPLWRLDDARAFNMRVIDMGNRVMMGELTPADSPNEVRLDVGGHARSSANTFGEGYCLNNDGETCFESELIAGNRNEMNCESTGYSREEPGNFMRGIAKSQARCANNLRYACPSDQYIAGIDGNGHPVCQAYTPPEPPLPDLPGQPSDPEDPSAQCGSANGVATSQAPSSGLCSPGTASGVSGNSTSGWNWNCTSGSTTASCSAPPTSQPPDTGACCGSSAGLTTPWAPTSGFCADANGTERGISGGTVNADANGWSWSCLYADCPAMCNSYRTPACGSANGVATGTAPSGNALCSSGGSTGATDGGTVWNWTCASANNSENVSCSAPKAAAPLCWQMDGADAVGQQLSSLPNSNTACTTAGARAHYAACNTPECYRDIGNIFISYTCQAGPCSNTPPTPAVCGSANGQILMAQPAASTLCQSGRASAVEGINPWSWTCYSEQGGASAECSTLPPMAGGCPTYPEGYAPGECQPAGAGWRCYSTRLSTYVDVQCEESLEPGGCPLPQACANGNKTCFQVGGYGGGWIVCPIGAHSPSDELCTLHAECN